MTSSPPWLLPLELVNGELQHACVLGHRTHDPRREAFVTFGGHLHGDLNAGAYLSFHVRDDLADDGAEVAHRPVWFEGDRPGVPRGRSLRGRHDRPRARRQGFPVLVILIWRHHRIGDVLLRHGHLGAYQQQPGSSRQSGLTGDQPGEPAVRDRVGKSEGVVLPCGDRGPTCRAVQKHGLRDQSGQIRVPREVVPHHAGLHMAVNPQRCQHPVELHPQQCWGERRVEDAVRDQLARRPREQPALPGDGHLLPDDWSLRVGLRRDQRPHVGLGESQLYGVVALLALARRLSSLLRVEIQPIVTRLLVDRRPREVLGHRGVELLDPAMVRREEEHHVPSLARAAPATLVDLLGRRARRGLFRLGDVRGGRPEDDESHLGVVRHVRAGRRRDVDAGEVPTVVLCLQPLLDLGVDVVPRLAEQPLAPLGREPRHPWLSPVPVPPGCRVQVRRPTAQTVQRVAERCHRLPRQRTAQPHPRRLDTPVGRAQRRCGAEEHRASHAPRGEVATQGRDLEVQPSRQRRRAVDVLVEDRSPVVVEVPDQLGPHHGVVQGHARRQDDRRLVVAHPQGVNDGRHQPQHATGPLEAFEGRPVVVEPVEQLRVDRVGRLQSLDVARLARVSREVGRVRPIEVRQRLRHLRARRFAFGSHRLEQAAPHDLEALLRARRAPRRLHPTDHGLEPPQRLPPAEADDHSSDVEVGGLGGREALRRLKSVIGRMESAWRPASPEESFEIVRRRLFEPMTAEGEAARSQVAQALANLYRSNAADFPADSRQPGYIERLEAAYPIHPELFDRLYNDWSTLERFQRTRGVLRLMAAVVHALWVRNDQAPVILPASVPLDDTVVRTELVRHLDDNWAPILDQDVDGPSSLPARLDLEVPTLGRYLAARRVARTVFLGSAPTLRSANRGVEAARVRLGCALPGESVATFGDALTRLSGRSTYLYSASGRYWYGTQPGVTRLAAERCERLLSQARDDVHAEIEKRLKAEHDRGDFAGVHVAPASSADVPDDPEVRLVVLGPSTPHIAKSEQTAARAAAQEIYERRGSSARERRNMVLFLAADHRRIEELDSAMAEHLAWASIDEEAGDDRLDLDAQQRRQAASERKESNDAVKLRLAETYVWALVPSQPDPQGPVVWEEMPITGQGGLFARASRKLVSDGVLYTTFAPALLRMQLDGVLASLWVDGHVEARVVWDHFTRYPYLPRLVSQAVLLDCATRGPSVTTWQDDAFALADAVADGRFAGLVAGEAALPAAAGTLLVRPEVAVAQQDVADPVVPPDEDDEDGKALAPGPRPVVPSSERAPTRYTGAVALEPDRAVRDFSTVVSEVVAHMEGQVGARVQITVEVAAERDEGFPSGVVRTVSENARVLKFTVNEFEGE